MVFQNGNYYYIFCSQKFLTLLTPKIISADIDARPGQLLQILVENQGRLTSSIYNRTYGIIGDALLNNKVINNWIITGFPFENEAKIIHLLNVIPFVRQEQSVLNRIVNRTSTIFANDPILFNGSFDVIDEISDTFINPTGWGKVECISYKKNFLLEGKIVTYLFFENQIGIHICKWF